MLKAYGNERREVFEAVATMFGAKKTGDNSDSFEGDAEILDKIAAGHASKLKNEAKIGKKN